MRVDRGPILQLIGAAHPNAAGSCDQSGDLKHHYENLTLLDNQVSGTFDCVGKGSATYAKDGKLPNQLAGFLDFAHLT